MNARDMMGKAGHACGERRAGGRARGLGRSGFTMIEMMVAVGAVAVISVGLAALFSSVGRTVSGGKRVSILNNYAGLIESRMRADFDAMTREGFLVIRQQWAMKTPADVVSDVPDNDAERIPVSAEDTAPRRRRIDEIAFFTRGSFTSARQPVNPEVNARSDAARVYYGHGQRVREDLSVGTSTYLQPELGNLNNDVNARLGFVPTGGMTNPNRFAGDWTLLRHELLLVNPENTTPQEYPATPGTTLNRTWDNDRQIAMQPATGSMFRWTNRRAGTPRPNPANPTGAGTAMSNAILVRTDVYATFPQFASGIVDIATTDLDEIRRIVLGATVIPSAIAVNEVFPDSSTPPNGNLAPTFLPTPFTQPPPPPTLPPAFATRPTPPQSVDRMHAWMEQSLPAQSAAMNPGGNEFYPIPNERPGMRMRYEPQPTNLLEQLRNANTTNIDKVARRADQLAMASNNFLPRCSEFIVEWSFGATWGGQIVWHGPRRWVDLNGNGLPDTNPNEVEMVLPYPFAPDGTPVPSQVRYPLVNNPAVGIHTYSDRLIYGYTPMHTTSVLTSYFGYVDPTFQPPLDGDDNGRFDDGQPAVATVPWPWPKMIRVTLTLSDAQNPEIESTFQFIFTTPYGQ